jgi:hypothetical protein
MESFLDKTFDLKQNGTNVKAEILAGITTFLTMGHIIVVNPATLQNAGMPFSGVLFATILVCVLSSLFGFCAHSSDFQHHAGCYPGLLGVYGYQTCSRQSAGNSHHSIFHRRFRPAHDRSRFVAGIFYLPE